MSNNVFQRSVSATLGLALASTGVFFSISSRAQTPAVPSVSTPAVPSVSTPAIPSVGTPTNIPVPNPTTTTVPTPGTPGTSTTTTTTTTTPATTTTTTTPVTTPATVAKKRTIVTVALKDKRFKTLVAALKAADLVDTLDGTGPFTVFAPTDAAFAKIPKKTLANLLKPENKEKLKAILTYHVVSGAVTSDMLKAGKVETVQGASLTVKKTASGTVSIDGTKLKKGNLDIKADNGVFHIVDSVLMPPATPAKKVPATTPDKK
jgi:uncharacterized surface protein with fasciclin (FAS1) repeats